MVFIMETTTPKKKLYEPFKMIDVDDDIKALERSAEYKTYILLYYNLEYEEYRYKEFTGRYDTYFGIRDILDAESVDLRQSKVLVEAVGRVGKKAMRVMSHPDESLNIIEFCHTVERFFGDNAYSIEEYDTGVGAEEESEKKEEEAQKEVTYAALKQRTNPTPEFDPYTSGQPPLDLRMPKEPNIFKVPKSPEFKPTIGDQPLFMPAEQAAELSKKYFTPASLEGTEGKEI